MTVSPNTFTITLTGLSTGRTDHASSPSLSFLFLAKLLLFRAAKHSSLADRPVPRTVFDVAMVFSNMRMPTQ